MLIGTDCISEGQNLQDCDYVINYDIHWNPVRIIQRFGRIDRIGRRTQCIQLVNYWPDITLDEYINLKERVENRMVIADVTATGDDNVLTAKSERRGVPPGATRRLQEEVIELEDLKTGISITDLGLNDFRMDLLKYVKAHGDLAGVAQRHACGRARRPRTGLPPGVIFALRNRNEGVNINRQNRLHPYYLVYVGGDGTVIAEHTEPKQLLDLVRARCKDRNEPIPEVYRPVQPRAPMTGADGDYSDLLAQAIRSMVDVKEEKDVDSLFTGGKTTALRQPHGGTRRFRTDRVPRRISLRRYDRGCFAYPKQAEFNRIVPKSKIYAHAKVSSGSKTCLSAQVAEIVWAYKLSPETINLPARAGS